MGKYICLLLSRKFLEHVKNIYITAFAHNIRCEANKLTPPLPPVAVAAAATKGKGKRGKGKAKDTSSSTPVANN